MTELLNTWREIGAYNRYAETKNAIFLGLLFALAGFLNAGQSNLLMDYLFGGNKITLYLTIALSATCCVLAIIPILTSPNFLIGRYNRSLSRGGNPYYFFEIAQFNSAESWLQYLRPPLAADDANRAKALAEQIWIISRITRRKFYLLKIAGSIFAIGWALSWLVQVVSSAPKVS